MNDQEAIELLARYPREVASTPQAIQQVEPPTQILPPERPVLVRRSGLSRRVVPPPPSNRPRVVPLGPLASGGPISLRSQYDIRGAMLGVESLRNHMTDEAWQFQLGMKHAGFALCGRNLDHDFVDVPSIVAATGADLLIIQDKREWDTAHWACWDKTAGFERFEEMFKRRGVARLTVFKDIGSDLVTQHRYHGELLPHGYVVYYHPDLLPRLAPWVSPLQTVRTYHSVDSLCVPEFVPQERAKAIVSGAVDPKYYPLRAATVQWASSGLLKGVDVLQHPGYNPDGVRTTGYLRTLSKYRVHIATASVLGFALRKIIESVACGCSVVTTLPLFEQMPEIEAALYRVPHQCPPSELQAVIDQAASEWRADRAADLAERAKAFYDYRAAGIRLAIDARAYVRRLAR